MGAKWIKYSELEKEPTRGEWFYRSGDSYSKGLIPKKDPGVLKLGSEPLEIWSQPIGREDWEGGRPADLRKKPSLYDLGSVAAKMTDPRFTASFFATLGRPSLDYQLAKAWASGGGSNPESEPEKTAPEEEEGYFLLNDGDLIIPGDEFFFWSCGWKEVDKSLFNFDQKYRWRESKFLPCRRKIEDGYRILGEGEGIFEGDEFLDAAGEWSPTIFSEKDGYIATSMAGPYRRKIEKPEEDRRETYGLTAGESYFLLVEGDLIKPGDEFLNEYREWKEAYVDLSGREWNPDEFAPFRRKVEDGYRMLEEGEIVREGDEFLADSGEWLLTGIREEDGRKVDPRTCQYRRKVETDKPRIRELIRDYQSNLVSKDEVDHALDAMCFAFSRPIKYAMRYKTPDELSESIGRFSTPPSNPTPRCRVVPVASLLEEAKQVEEKIWQAVDRNEKLLEEEKASERDGEEWRYVLLKDGELLEAGDEYYSAKYKEWRAADCDGYLRAIFDSTVPAFRRKISWDPLADQGEEDEKPKIWRELEVGEVVERGDEVKTRDNWRPAPGWIVGYRWDGGMASFRRKVDSDRNPGEGYRILERGEIIRDGDEYFHVFHNAWISTCLAGVEVGDTISSERYRRKIVRDQK